MLDTPVRKSTNLVFIVSKCAFRFILADSLECFYADNGMLQSDPREQSVHLIFKNGVCVVLMYCSLRHGFLQK